MKRRGLATAPSRPAIVLWAPGTSLAFGFLGVLLLRLFELAPALSQAPLLRAFVTWWPRWFWIGLAGALVSAAWTALPKDSRWRPLALGFETLLLVATLAMMAWGIAAGFMFASSVPADL
jgi:hypothetical protein